MFEFESLTEPGLFRLTEDGDVVPAFRPREHGTKGNRDDVRERV